MSSFVASFFVYAFMRPTPTANYGELLLPPESITRAAYRTASAQAWMPGGAACMTEELCWYARTVLSGSALYRPTLRA